ncbi:killer cell lectin-like receptor subfamily F member 2 isoform 1-T1 [Discoglossus pictus]
MACTSGQDVPVIRTNHTDCSSLRLLCLVVGLTATSLLVLIVTERVTMNYNKLSRKVNDTTNGCIAPNSSRSDLTSDKKDGHQRVIQDLQNKIKRYKQSEENLKNELRQAKEESNDLCPDRWTRHKQRCLIFSTYKKTWKESRQICEYNNASLLILNPEDLNLKRVLVSKNVDYWVGLRIAAPVYKWRWLDGSPGSGTGLYGDCGLITSDGMISGEDCGAPYNFICERKITLN